MDGPSLKLPSIRFIWLMVLSCLLLRFDAVFAQVSGDCSSSSITDEELRIRYDNPERKNAQFEGLLVEFPMENMIRIDATSISNMNRMYIDATYDQTTQILRVFATAEMQYYETEQWSSELTLNIDLICTSNTRRLRFRQFFDDSNNHAPVFGQPKYALKIPLPLPKGFVLNFDPEIIARDLDILNNRVTFSTTSELAVIEIGTSERIGEDRKTFYPTIMTTQQLLRLSAPLEFTIIGTDSATPPRTGNATVTIEADTEVAFLEMPQFEQPFYRVSLNLDWTLNAPLELVIKENTFSKEIAFAFDGGDQNLFSYSNVENVVTVVLARPLTSADIQNRALLMTTLVANLANVDRGSTVILIDVPSVAWPSFEDTINIGSLDINRRLSLDQLTIIPDTYDSSIMLSMEGVNAELFRVSNVENVVTVELSRELTQSDVDGKSVLSASVRASRPNVGDGLAAVVVEVGTTTPFPTVVVPKFSKPLYRGSLGLNLELSDIESVIVDEQTFDSNVTFSINADNDNELFRIDNTSNSVAVSLSRPLTEEDVTDRTYLVAVVSANRPDADPVSTVMLVNVPVTTPRPTIVTPVFMEPVYHGSIDRELELTVANIVLLESTYTDAISFELRGDDSTLFSITNLRNLVSIQLRPGLTDDQIKQRNFLSFEVVANHPEANRARTAVVISLPVDSSPTFENKLYTFTIKTDTSGSIGRVQATVSSEPSTSLQYRLGSHEYLTSRLAINSVSGELVLGTQLIEGTYTLEVFVIDPSTSLGGQSEIRIIVETISNCPDTSVENSLLVKYLIENKEHTDFMSSIIGDCSFQVIKMTPNDEVFLSVNSETRQLTTIALDRESEIFDGMAVPQIQVTLKLQCDNQLTMSSSQPDDTPLTTNLSRSARSIDPQYPDKRFYVLTESIPFSTDTTILTIIIEDENDNSPQFVRPLNDNQWLGYPGAELASNIMPPHLYQVQAIDRDAGINAQILYSLVDSVDFQINGETGIITPTRDSLRTNEVRVTIKATDRNGASDGLSNTRTVNVKRLEEHHIAVITIQEEDIDEVDYILDIIAKTVLLNVLHSAIIPMEVENTGRAGGQVSALRMYVYGFDTSNMLLEASAIQEKLQDFDSQIYTLTTVTYEKHITNNGDGSSLTGLIVGCSILFALLLLSVLGTFLLWWFKIRPYDYLKMEDTTSVSSQRDLSTPAMVIPQSSPIMKIDRFEVEKRDSYEIRGSTLDDTDDNKSVHTLAASLTKRLDQGEVASTTNSGSSPTSTLESRDNTRKSNGVHFNEQVERIDILLDSEPDHPNGDHLEGSDMDRVEKL